MSDTITDYDYLIVGHGIAGAAMAWHLHEINKSFQIVNDPSLPSSSYVAAGIFNPLTGKKMNKTWLADDLFPFADSFYKNLQEKLGADFVHSTPLYRPYRSIEEQNSYLAQSEDERVASYIGDHHDQSSIAEYVNMKYGALEIARAGWIDMPLLLDRSRSFFLANNLYLECAFDVNELIPNENFVVWKGLKYKKVILCQGFAATGNNYFSWLAFNPVKGQILEIDTEDVLKPYIINQGIFILPVKEKQARVGATYSWEPLDWQPTREAAAELEEKLKQLLKVPYKITGHVAGIRPSVTDRKPLIGTHPEHNNICIFNGLGTKGVTLAPFFANQFVQHLENGKELNPLVNIKRYFSLYFR